MRTLSPPTADSNERGGAMADRAASGEAAEVPFRQVLDGDPDRGVAVYDGTLRLVYANPAARVHLHAGEGAVSLDLTRAVQTFRDRLERSDTAAAPAEILLTGEANRESRATFAHLSRGSHHWFVVRLSP